VSHFGAISAHFDVIVISCSIWNVYASRKFPMNNHFVLYTETMYTKRKRNSCGNYIFDNSVI